MINIFISYSHSDRAYKDRFEVHLGALINHYGIRVWDDDKITIGAEWETQVLNNLVKSNFIIFLLSPDSITSKYIIDKELPIALQLYSQNKAAIMPILVHNCQWKLTNFERFKILPKDGIPISSSEQNTNQAFDQVTTAIANYIEDIKRAENDKKEKERRKQKELEGKKNREKELERKRREEHWEHTKAWLKYRGNQLIIFVSSNLLGSLLGILALCLSAFFYVDKCNQDSEIKKIKKLHSSRYCLDDILPDKSHKSYPAVWEFGDYCLAQTSDANFKTWALLNKNKITVYTESFPSDVIICPFTNDGIAQIYLYKTGLKYGEWNLAEIIKKIQKKK